MERTDDDEVVLVHPGGTDRLTVEEASALGGELVAQAMKAAMRRALDPGAG